MAFAALAALAAFGGLALMIGAHPGGVVALVGIACKRPTMGRLPRLRD